MAGIKIDITASGKDFARQLREYTQETRALNAEQERASKATARLAKEELALATASARLENENKRLENSNTRLRLSAERTALSTQQLKNRTDDLNARRQRGVRAVVELANEQIALSNSNARTAQQSRRLAESETRLEHAEQQSVITAERLTQARDRLAINATRLRMREEELEGAQSRGVRTAVILAREQMELARSNAMASQQTRRLRDAEERLGITEERTALSTTNLRHAQARSTISADRLELQTENLRQAQARSAMSADRLAQSQARANSVFRTGLTSIQGFALALSSIATGVIAKGLFDIGSELESVTIKFETLLGSTSKAQERLEEIERFSSSTPFQFPDVAKASALLETFGGEVLATGKNLELVGDASAISGQKIEELSLHFGRLSDGLKNNRAVGESLMRFQELGLVSGKLRGEIEELQKVGRGEEAWKRLQNSLDQRVGGAMERLSKSATGLASTLKDKLFAVVRKSLDKSGVWTLFKEGLESSVGSVDDLNNSVDTSTDKFLEFHKSLAGIIIIGQGVWETFKFLGKSIFDVISKSMDNLILLVTAQIDITAKLLKGDFKGALESVTNTAKDLGSNTFEVFENITDNAKDYFEVLRNGEHRYSKLIDKARELKEAENRTAIVGKESSSSPLVGGTSKKGFQGSNPFAVDLLGFADDEGIDLGAEKEKKMALASLTEEMLKTTLDGEIALLHEQKDKKLEIAEDNAKLMIAIKDDTAKKEFEITKKYKDLEKRQTLQNLSVTQNALSAGFATAKLFAGKNKGLAISEALLNGALGITKTFATYGATPAGFAGSSLIGANTALQVQEISRQKFADGGFVSGSGTGRSDSINASLSSGEFVANQRATAQNLPMLQRMNAPNNHTVNVTFQPSISVQSSDNNGSLEDQLRKSAETLVDIIKGEQHRGAFA